MMRAVIYVRVSSDEQVKGMSLDFQKQDCLAYAAKKGIEVVQVYEERGESAKFTDRPELIKLLDHCTKRSSKIDALIVWKLDRLSRNQLDYYYIKRKLLKQGINIFSATESSLDDPTSISSKVFETFSALQAEIDNHIRSERTRKGMEAKIKSGIYPWKPPIGYLTEYAVKHGVKKTRPDIPDPKLFPIIQSVLREYGKGMCSQNDLVAMLNRRGLAKIRCRPTYKQLVARLLYDYLDYYRGYLFNPWAGEKVKGLHEPMLTELEYLQIMAVRDGRGAFQKSLLKRTDNPSFPLRRSLVCPYCNRFYTASYCKGRRQSYPYYWCHNKTCPMHGKNVPSHKVEAEFVSIADQYTLSHKYLDAIKRRYEKYIALINKTATDNSLEAESQMKALEEKRRRIFEMREDGSYSSEEFRERKNDVEQQINSVRLKQLESSTLLTHDESVFAYGHEFINRFGSKWSQMPPDVFPVFKMLLIPKGITYDQGKGFGTPEIGPIFNLNGEDDGEKSPLVGHAGPDWNQIIADLKKLANFIRGLQQEYYDEEANLN